MPFDVELAFTGLGVVLLRSAEEKLHNPNPDSVEFLLLRTQEPAPQTPPQVGGPENGEHHHPGGPGLDHHAVPHLPRLWFRLEDLVDPADPDDPALFEDMVAGPEGLPVVRLRLDGRDFTITVEEELVTEAQQGFVVQWKSERESTASSSLDFDLDLIPDLKEHFGLDPIIPDTESLPEAYTARVKLPAGGITTRRPLLDPGTTLASWVFVERDGTAKTTPQALTDQVIWSRKNIKALHIDGAFNRRLTLDASVRERYGEGSRVTMAITNLPGTAISGRFGLPGHFALLRQLANSQEPREIQHHPPLTGGTRITAGGACPPARQEASGS